MSACLMIGAAVMQLAAASFTLSWDHSVEHVQWQEDWRILPDGLSLERARIKGSGAGMEPGENAVLRDGWWEWPGDLVTETLVLGASGATGGGWTLCSADLCRILAETPGEPVRIAPCDAGESPSDSLN